MSQRSQDFDYMKVNKVWDFVVQLSSLFVDPNERNGEENGSREKVDGPEGVVSRAIVTQLVKHSS